VLLRALCGYAFASVFLCGKWVSQAKITGMMLKAVLDMLACPVETCRKPLTLSTDEKSLQCTGCGRIYPVRDGIPILLVEEAKP
jgi:uncharacterized protein YbaR (Trm112 family)